MKYLIVAADPQHAEVLTEIAIAAKRHWNYPEAWIQFWTPQLTISSEYISSNEVWMMTDDGRPIAFYTLSQDEEGYELGHFWVLPEYIGKGIGRQLFDHALERCKLLNIPALKIYADPNTQSFYEKMGAYKVGEHHSEVDGQPRILPVMEIQL